ncbi:sigma-54-dependent transcriptional regulator [Desulfurobacterium atlanticum]|uniref:Two-component system, NtrC family, nitrogen regulation response regulator NtrX n=1 Tax=Desulfurobacterium atlanticum TaxID=240169 RepID=A0A238Z3V0_9BACT|nr:sigma-54 dependent transcriptional regulator [Desulfurobacterium atlanticum]SNR77561.1 two-component system, NtrC family, nitrogen regulation response regulator NtrX [Desulfurobacterium atlanticum]
MKILIIDDEAGIRESLSGILEDEGYSISTAESGNEGLEKIETENPDIIILDLFLPGIPGMEILKQLLRKKITEKAVVIVISGHGNIQTAVEAIKNGAFDFIEKPINFEKLLSVLEKAKKQLSLLKETVILKEKLFSETIIGNSPVMEKLKREIEAVAPVDSTVIIYGESGTGKELVARTIHQLSKRSSAPFVPINCAAIPDNLIEAELFGYEKGAFTGANARKKGKFEIADGGTIFLDEIGDMPLMAQSKLLRVLEDKVIEKIGSVERINVDVRVISATNKNLEKAIEDGSFREDLYYRLNVIPIHVPPLRERGNDILLLADYFLSKFSADYKREKIKLSESVKEIFLTYHWPGNIRELKNLIERLVILAKKEIIEPEDLPENMFAKKRFSINRFLSMPLKEAKEKFEKEYIIATLKETKGDMKLAAAKMQIDLSNLYRKMNKYGIGNDTV